MTKRYEWYPTESAHELYPMYIVYGDIIYTGNKSIYVPSKSIFHQGWGSHGSTHIAGDSKKGVPTRLEIQYFSFVENKFYEGEFDLDTESIQKMLDSKHYSLSMLEYTHYDSLIVGCGPGGRLAIWLGFPNRVRQIFYGIASEVEGDWQAVAKDYEGPREEMVRLDLEETLTDDQKRELKERGIQPNYMDQFQEKYRWFLNFDSKKLPNFVDFVEFYNGELNYFFQPFERTMLEDEWAIPKSIRIHWFLNGADKRNSEIDFNQDSVQKAFREISQQYPSIPIEVYIKPDENQQGKITTVMLRKLIPDTEPDKKGRYLEIPVEVDSVKTTGTLIRDIFINMTEDTKITTGWEPIVSAEEDD